MTFSGLIAHFVINRLKEDGNKSATAFPVIGTYRDWRYRVNSKQEDGKVIKYSIAFYRLSEGGWYDEIRHDSHDVVRGRATIAPHFHMKLRCGFKDSPKGGIEEIKRIIDNHLETLRGVVQ